MKHAFAIAALLSTTSAFAFGPGPSQADKQLALCLQTISGVNSNTCEVVLDHAVPEQADLGAYVLHLSQQGVTADFISENGQIQAQVSLNGTDAKYSLMYFGNKTVYDRDYYFRRAVDKINADAIAWASKQKTVQAN